MTLNELVEQIDELLAKNPQAGYKDVVVYADHGQTQIEAQSIDIQELDDENYSDIQSDTVVEIYAP